MTPFSPVFNSVFKPAFKLAHDDVSSLPEELILITKLQAVFSARLFGVYQLALLLIFSGFIEHILRLQLDAYAVGWKKAVGEI
jgi:hypothetical protein